MKYDEQIEMTPKDRYNFYKDAYFHGLDTPNKILMRTSILLAGLAIITTVYLEALKLKVLDVLPTNIRYIVMAIAIILLLLSVVFCFLTLLRRPYKLFNSKKVESEYISKDVPKFLSDVNRYNDKVSILDKKYTQTTEGTLVLEYFIKNLVEYGADNQSINDKRQKWFHYSLYSILLNFVLITIVMIIIQIGMPNMSDEKEKTEDIKNEIPEPPKGPEAEISKYTQED